MNKALDLLREIRPSIPKEVLELWCKDRDAFLASHPAVEQAGGDERAAFRPAQVISYRPGVGEVTIYVAGRVPGYMNIGDTVYVSDRAPVEQPIAALAQPSPVSEALIYACKNLAQITSSDGSGHADIALAVLRMAGVGDDERERLVNEWKAARAWKPSPAQAEAERPPQPERYTADVFHPERPYYMAQTSVVRASDFDEFATQYERIVGALRFERQQMDRAFTACINERDAALDRVAELEKQEPVAFTTPGMLEVAKQLPQTGRVGARCKRDRRWCVPLYAAPAAQAQHSVPARRAEFSQFLSAVMDAAGLVRYGRRSKELSEYLGAQCMKYRLSAPVAQAGQVPQAWLDVQAERRRQVEVEGYHGFRDNHYISYELSKAARAYIEVSWHALSGGLPCKKPESWPWMAGFKWSDGRTMLVKACALALAEIERLDRTAHGKEGV
ncbi:TPA: hypothetical protein OT313_002498 [Pseudomonas aeruginosa]|nr:hypothetical protein [Pseudomonas aeruginosa]